MAESPLKFRWHGRNRLGQRVSGETAASDVAALHTRLAQAQIRVLRCRPVRSATPKLRARDRLVMTRQLATLLHAGLPLLQALTLFEQGQAGQPSLAQLAATLRQDIEAGHPFHQALRQHTDFPALYTDLVAVGEMAGMLDTLLERLADHLEKTEALQSRLRAALAYPLAVVVIATGVVGVILSWVVPAFETIFRSFNAELPAITRWVLACSRRLTEDGVWLLALVGATGLGGWRAWQGSETVKRWVDGVCLQLPLAGDLLHKACLVRWARALATLVGAGIPLVEAMDTVANVSGNRVYTEVTRTLSEALTRGQSLTHALQHHPRLFSPLLIQMVQVGEESGTLEAMLAKAATFHEREVDTGVTALSSLMEPALMVFLGLVIGGLVVAMYLPIFQLGQVV